MSNGSAKIPFQYFFLQEAHVSSSGMGRDVHSVHSCCPSSISSPDHGDAHQSALKDSFGKAVVAHDMLEQCGFPSPDS